MFTYVYYVMCTLHSDIINVRLESKTLLKYNINILKMYTLHYNVYICNNILEG